MKGGRGVGLSVKAWETLLLWLNSCGLYSVPGQGAEQRNPSCHGTASTCRGYLLLIYPKVLYRRMGAWRHFTLCSFNGEKKVCGLVSLNSNASLRKTGTGSANMWLVTLGWGANGPGHCTLTILCCEADGRPIPENSPELPSQKPRAPFDSTSSLPALCPVNYQPLKFLLYIYSLIAISSDCMTPGFHIGLSPMCSSYHYSQSNDQMLTLSPS